MLMQCLSKYLLPKYQCGTNTDKAKATDKAKDARHSNVSEDS